MYKNGTVIEYKQKFGDLIQMLSGTIVARHLLISDMELFVIKQTDDRPIDNDFECIIVPSWDIVRVISEPE